MGANAQVSHRSPADQSIPDEERLGRQRNAELLKGSFEISKTWIGIHPRLFASGEELDRIASGHREDPNRLAASLPAEQGAELTGPILPFEKGENAHRNAIYIARLAVAYRITRDERYHARLREWLPTFRSYVPPAMGSIGDIVGLNAGHMLLGFSIAYDVLKGQGDSKLEEALLDVVLRQGDRTFRDLISLRSFPYEQNHLVIPVCGLALAASLLADNHLPAKEWGIFSNNSAERWGLVGQVGEKREDITAEAICVVIVLGAVHVGSGEVTL